ncbi:hypothetical protein CTI12_AA433360 [Artemisia annua]|uniref:TPX2 C-terminal domain-containing protein n=1 Tax=Artemisia annua TaxID=35608 RepID=A0A2U1M0I0_ARTAN|nr:hypothetical protein CTI12_AA433360 [Artemisia annua]
METTTVTLTPSKPKSTENTNPNISISSPNFKPKHSNSPLTKSAAKTLKSSIPIVSLKNKIRERKFVVAKRSSKNKTGKPVECRCGKGSDGSNRCLCVAYESLRASQEEFFKVKSENEVENDDVSVENEDVNVEKSGEAVETAGDKRPREVMRRSIPEPGSGKVMDLSSESSASFGGRRWKRRVRATSQQPFMLRTEQRGQSKQEEFMKKVQEMLVEQEKQRIPIAQPLPLTTDEPECLVKPPVKESTRPVDLVLHSDVRAVERAEFDQQVQEKLSYIEQYKLEREKEQKLEEEEELKRLRKELIPKAQPMPYFDRPFIPRRSEKQPTIPKEPKFHNPQHKKIKCCMSWNDVSQCTMFDLLYRYTAVSDSNEFTVSHGVASND